MTTRQNNNLVVRFCFKHEKLCNKLSWHSPLLDLRDTPHTAGPPTTDPYPLSVPFVVFVTFPVILLAFVHHVLAFSLNNTSCQ
jgi:hypothetical protein